MSIRKNPIVRKKKILVQDLTPNVQRLLKKYPELTEDFMDIPEALAKLINHSDKILKEKQYLIEIDRFRGNTRELKHYKGFLPKKLSRPQFDWAAGVVISDGTLQFNNNGEDVRIKIQQVNYHRPFITVTRGVLAPYFMGPISEPKPDSEPKEGKKKNTMVENQSISCKPLMEVALLFQDKNTPIRGKACVRKRISPELQKHLTPPCIAAWFIGDGGRQDYAVKWGGKGLQLHTQGFSPEDVKLLALLLAEKYDWKVEPCFDGLNTKDKEKYLLNIHSSCFESFIEHIGPYIPEYFYFKLPDLRSPNSRFSNEVIPLPPKFYQDD